MPTIREDTFIWRKWPGREVTEVWGEISVSSGDIIHSYDIGLKSIINILFTPESNTGVIVTKYIMNKGQNDNYASVWIWDDRSTPHTGSLWLNFYAIGK